LTLAGSMGLIGSDVSRERAAFGAFAAPICQYGTGGAELIGWISQQLSEHREIPLAPRVTGALQRVRRTRFPAFPLCSVSSVASGS
jgi:hypothetical protein